MQISEISVHFGQSLSKSPKMYYHNRQVIINVHSTKLTYKSSYINFCQNVNFYVHYDGVIAPSSFFYDKIITNYNFRVKYFFSFESDEKILFITTAGEKPKRIRATYAVYRAGQVERKTEYYDVNKIQNRIKLNKQLKVFEITDNENHTIFFSFFVLEVLERRIPIYYLEPKNMNSNSIAKLEKINSSFIIKFFYHFNRERNERRDLLLIDIVNNTSNLIEGKIDEIRLH